MSWVACVNFVLNQIHVSARFACQPNFAMIVKTKLINRFKDILKCTLTKCKENNQGKLRTYALFKKKTFQKEKYLSFIKDADVRKCLMSFRISAPYIRNRERQI